MEPSGKSFRFVKEVQLFDPEDKPLKFGSLDRTDRDLAKMNFITNGRYLHYQDRRENGFWDLENGKIFNLGRVEQDHFAFSKFAFDHSSGMVFSLCRKSPTFVHFTFDNFVPMKFLPNSGKTPGDFLGNRLSILSEEVF